MKASVLIQKWLNQEGMILKAVMHVKVQAMGMTFSAEKKMDLYMVLGVMMTLLTYKKGKCQ
jgi:hypothetical protein